MQDVMQQTLQIYKWPSQAYWRYFEVEALRKVSCERPILEIGCGDGRFSGLVFASIDEAIDINPRSIEKCRQWSGGLYGQIRCLDVRDLRLAEGRFATVYANCVLEHVPDLPGVLAGCFSGLRHGGKLVITVPLLRMNEHLLFPWKWYARMRQRQLSHVNLHSEEGWESTIREAGFSGVDFHPYLSGPACRLWDLVDSPGCIGFGRYRLAAAAGLVTKKLLPKSAKSRFLSGVSAWLRARAEAQSEKKSPCAALIIAYKT
jgi:SAM-dependent methyltransferase